MKIAVWPDDQELNVLLSRPVFEAEKNLSSQVRNILDEVKQGGDAALISFARRFDGVDLEALCVSSQEFLDAQMNIQEELKNAIALASHNIAEFHKAQKPNDEVLETMPGVRCWRKSVPVSRVGLYVPGGTAPLFSTVLMLAIPAVIAGCDEIVLCTPPGKDGNIHPAILYAAWLSGVTKVIKAGGAQAIAALAYGTESVPKVDKIFGPGNRFVTCAKQLVATDTCAIDMPAGPSEVMLVADTQANPAFLAADFLSQAEHGSDSQSLLVVIASRADGAAFAQTVEEEIKRQIEPSRAVYLSDSLAHSSIIVVKDVDTAVFIINAYAPEHLIINCEQYKAIEKEVKNAGSVFLGPWTPESAGDYASGTNHTLPTGGWARSYSGVSLDSFFKKITIQEITQTGLKNIGKAVSVMAREEQLPSHARAVELRLESMKGEAL